MAFEYRLWIVKVLGSVKSCRYAGEGGRIPGRGRVGPNYTRCKPSVEQQGSEFG